MSRIERRGRRWHYAFLALLVVLGVAAMHAGLDAVGEAGASHEAVAVASHSDGPVSPMPGPADPSAPTDPCHAASQACCVSAMPTWTPRQATALLIMAIVVVIGTMQVSLLRRALTLRAGLGWRPPPDLAALCVLRT